MSRVVHFEIHAEDPQRAAEFYHRAFGWTIRRWEGPQEYWLCATGSASIGINGGILRRQGPPPSDDQPVSGFVCTIGVGQLDAAIDRVKAAGGRQVAEPTDIPGIGRLAYCKDTESNTFAVIEPLPEMRRP